MEQKSLDGTTIDGTKQKRRTTKTENNKTKQKPKITTTPLVDCNTVIMAVRLQLTREPIGLVRGCYQQRTDSTRPKTIDAS